MSVEIAALVAIADGLAEAAGERISEASDAADVSDTMFRLSAAVEEKLAEIKADAGESRIACGPGCRSCCVVNVSVLVPEAAAIAGYLQRTIQPGVLVTLKEKISLQAEKVRWLDDQERPCFRISCAFLDERGWCLIHPVRPILCRSISSDNPKACEAVFSDGEVQVMMDFPQKILCSLVFSGVARVLQDAGMDCRSLELNRMVSNLLDRPVLVDDFLARKRLVFL